MRYRCLFPVTDDGSEVRAPLAGVVAGLRAATNDVCVFLPVDCPYISAATLRRLGAAAPAISPSGPLPGAFTRDVLELFERKLGSGDYSLRDVPATVVEIDEDELANINTPAELSRLSAAR